MTTSVAPVTALALHPAQTYLQLVEIMLEETGQRRWGSALVWRTAAPSLAGAIASAVVDLPEGYFGFYLALTAGGDVARIADALCYAYRSTVYGRDYRTLRMPLTEPATARSEFELVRAERDHIVAVESVAADSGVVRVRCAHHHVMLALLERLWGGDCLRHDRRAILSFGPEDKIPVTVVTMPGARPLPSGTTRAAHVLAQLPTNSPLRRVQFLPRAGGGHDMDVMVHVAAHVRPSESIRDCLVPAAASAAAAAATLTTTAPEAAARYVRARVRYVLGRDGDWQVGMQLAPPLPKRPLPPPLPTLVEAEPPPAKRARVEVPSLTRKQPTLAYRAFLTAMGHNDMDALAPLCTLAHIDTWMASGSAARDLIPAVEDMGVLSTLREAVRPPKDAEGMVLRVAENRETGMAARLIDHVVRTCPAGPHRDALLECVTSRGGFEMWRRQNPNVTL